MWCGERELAEIETERGRLRVRGPDQADRVQAPQAERYGGDDGHLASTRSECTHGHIAGTVEQGAGDVNESADGTFASGTLATDKTFEFEFAEPGTYPYFCEIHPATMRGEITVR